jgi:hypothetical protein
VPRLNECKLQPTQHQPVLFGASVAVWEDARICNLCTVLCCGVDFLGCVSAYIASLLFKLSDGTHTEASALCDLDVQTFVSDLLGLFVPWWLSARILVAYLGLVFFLPLKYHTAAFVLLGTSLGWVVSLTCLRVPNAAVTAQDQASLACIAVKSFLSWQIGATVFLVCAAHRGHCEVVQCCTSHP